LGADWWPEMKGRALAIVSILANTPPADWRWRSEIHEGLAEFRRAGAGEEGE
jgi:hypothetical protein